MKSRNPLALLAAGAEPFWGRWAEMRRKPGTDMNSRRRLPEIRCLSQGLPRGICSRVSRAPMSSKVFPDPLH